MNSHHQDKLEQLLDLLFSQATIKRTVTSGDLRLNYFTTSQRHLTWSEDYLTPYYNFLPSESDGAYDVISSETVEIYDQLLSCLKDHPSSQIRGCKDVPVLEYVFENDLRVQTYLHRPGATILDAARHRWTFITTPDDAEAVHEPVRIMRELFTKELEQLGFYVFHAGAVVIGNHGFAICGPKGAGKTTTVLGLAEDGQASFVSNDRIYIGPLGKSKLTLRGWPTTTVIGLGTCYHSPALRHWLQPDAQRTYSIQRHLSHHSDAMAFMESLTETERWKVREKIDLTSSEIALTLNTPLVASAPLDGFLFPEVDPLCEQLEIVIPDAEWMRARLMQEAITPHDHSYPDWLHRRSMSTEDVDVKVAELVERLISETRAYRIHFRNMLEARSQLAEVITGQRLA